MCYSHTSVAAQLNHISGGLGLTALGCAAKCGHPAIVKELLAHGADIEARRKDNGQTPLLEAAARGQLGSCKVRSHPRVHDCLPMAETRAFRVASGAGAARGWCRRNCD